MFSCFKQPDLEACPFSFDPVGALWQVSDICRAHCDSPTHQYKQVGVI